MIIGIWNLFNLSIPREVFSRESDSHSFQKWALGWARQSET